MWRGAETKLQQDGDEAEEKQLDFNEAVAVSRTKMAQDHSIWSARVARLFRQYLMGHGLARAALAAGKISVAGVELAADSQVFFTLGALLAANKTPL